MVNDTPRVSRDLDPATMDSNLLMKKAGKGGSAMFDEVICQARLPGLPFPPGTMCQTKSLFNTVNRLTVTVDGRLVWHRVRMVPTEVADSDWPLRKQVPLGDLDLKYHGDLLLYGADAKGHDQDVVIRFTHGVAERAWRLEEAPIEVWIVLGHGS